MQKECEHFREEKQVSQNTKKCEECEKEHLPTVALRMCLTCGHVGCCDSSIGKHATKHFEETGHPVMQAVPENTLSNKLLCRTNNNLINFSASQSLWICTF